MTTAIIDGALFAAHQAGALGHDIGTLSEWRDALLAMRAKALEDAALACEAEHVGESLGDGALPDGDIAYNTALQHAAAAIRALK